jgi:sugar phosphate isomerase/epimerase
MAGTTLRASHYALIREASSDSLSAMNTRRRFLSTLAATIGGTVLGASAFRLRYLASSSMYGTMKLEEILPELKKIGATHLDLWPKPHGDQREQAKAMGDAAFAELLAKHGVKLGCVTRYDLGPLRLAGEMKWAAQFGCGTFVCGGRGPKGLKGDELRKAVQKFAEEMKPHCEVAESLGAKIAIENHANGLMESPESIRYLTEFAPSPALGIALAPYHLPQDESELAALIRECGERLFVFYAWQHGKGSGKQPKPDEMLQLPGRGPLDFGPLVAALREIDYKGWTSIFMHPYPRGLAIVEGGTSAVTEEINRSRAYLESKLNG